MRKSHNPTPVRTQSHHRYPVYLQKRLWGEVRLEDRLALCGTDHDSVHTWVAVLLGEQQQPTLDPGWLVKNEAHLVIEWYRAEQAKLAVDSGYSEGAFGSGSYGDKHNGDPGATWDGVE